MGWRRRLYIIVITTVYNVNNRTRKRWLRNSGEAINAHWSGSGSSRPIQVYAAHLSLLNYSKLRAFRGRTSARIHVQLHLSTWRHRSQECFPPGTIDIKFDGLLLFYIFTSETLRVAMSEYKIPSGGSSSSSYHIKWDQLLFVFPASLFLTLSSSHMFLYRPQQPLSYFSYVLLSVFSSIFISPIFFVTVSSSILFHFPRHIRCSKIVIYSLLILFDLVVAHQPWNSLQISFWIS